MKGRPQKFDEELVLNKAQQVFWEKGYSATSLDEVLAAMGIGSGSFYNSFKGGKKQLYMNVLRQRRDALKEFRANARASSNPIELIRDFFRELADADQTTHLRGCLIANTVTEMTFLNDDIENEAVNILKETEQFYTETIRMAQANGQLKNQTDAAILGRYLITLWNGLNVTRRMYPDKLILKYLIEMQLKIIQ
jgi:TetR/AcrR family transcriptional repressor of nem operon